MRAPCIRLLLVSLHIALLFTASSWAQSQKIALVVGVSKYAKSGFAKLNFAHSDALALAELLERSGFDVCCITEADATYENIEARIGELVSQSKLLNKDDVVLVYVAGHGIQRSVTRETKAGRIKEEAPFFCAHDSIKSNTSTLVSIDWIISELANNSGSDHNLVIADACRDNIDRGIDGTGLLTLPSNVSVFWACSPGQKSHESESLKHGIFTHFLMNGLRGAAANSRAQVDWLSLAAYVRNEVAFETPVLLDDPDAAQNPNLIGNHLGSPVLRESPAAQLPQLLRFPCSPESCLNACIEWADALNVECEFEDDVGIKFSLIPPGEFLMGTDVTNPEQRRADEQAHTVRITRPFYCSTSEVTQSQWTAVMGTSPWLVEVDEFVRVNPQHPAVLITWEDAKRFCERLGQRNGRLVRLLTEAEWEYVCRAGTKSPFHCGDAENLNQAAWFKDNAWEQGERFAHPVMQKQKNSFGIFDLHGNVSEYCEDFYSEQYYAVSPTENPRGANVGTKHVLRGGSFAHDSDGCRSARRIVPSRHKDSTVGFRVVCEIAW